MHTAYLLYALMSNGIQINVEAKSSSVYKLLHCHVADMSLSS